LPRLNGVALDMVTFGTPHRYAWQPGGYARRLHFVHRRPTAPDRPSGTEPSVADLMRAADGDYVQQLGVAAADAAPSLFAWRARLANRRLDEVLSSGPPAADDGSAILVDYGEPDGNIAHHQAGHAVYAQKKWLLFHIEEVARRFYPAREIRAA
jgi:hypothetical protein